MDNQRFLFQDIKYHLTQSQKQIDALISLHYSSMKDCIRLPDLTGNNTDSQIVPFQTSSEAF